MDDKSKLDKDLADGKTKVAGEERNIKKANRKTDKGKSLGKTAEAERRKNDEILKANQKKKTEDDESDWESVEEDAPVIQLTDLLGNM